MEQKFLHKTISDLLDKSPDLSGFSFAFPGKRPIVFIKKILREKGYTGFLPDFFTIEELISQIADTQEVKGATLWLFAYEVYRKLYPSEDFSGFLKWFPTLQKDWDDMMKFAESDKAVLEFMLDEERIKDWAQNLGDEADTPRKKFLNFWKKMNDFLPVLKKELAAKGWSTSGMTHEIAKKNLKEFAKDYPKKVAFIGFNAFTPVEESLVREMLQWNKAEAYFQSDHYYMDDERQEAGNFLRHYLKWKEFNDSRPFKYIENDFKKPKNIQVYEVSGNISQTKILPEILERYKGGDFSETAVVLLDENLLPATLDAVNAIGFLNITMGFPIKNLSFTNAVKRLFYLQKQLEKKDSTYYYNDIFPILEELPNSLENQDIISDFKNRIEERNIIYISKKKLEEFIGKLSYFDLFKKAESAREYLDRLIDFCFKLKFQQLDDIQFENVSYFEKSFKVIKNQIEPYDFVIKMDTLEALINQIINNESIDFQGEPLQGLQIMGLLETRLLNFENIILLSVNEGKLPAGNSQNTYLPFDVRRHFGLHTYLENDGIYAYHFYRLLQDSKNVHLLYNALSSGVNTGEKSRFITQLEFESGQNIEHTIIENASEPIADEPITIKKTPAVMQRLEEWKKRVSASHLTSYIYNPVDFYFSKILKTRETDEIEEELSVRNYGNLIHYSLEEIYAKIKGKILTVSDLGNSIQFIDEAINLAIEKLKHQAEFYERGMNFIHKSIAKRVLEQILKYDLKLVQEGNSLEILDLEKQFEGIKFSIDDEGEDFIEFYGFIDRIDRLNGTVRIIDYKTAKTKNLNLKIDENNLEDYLMKNDRKQAMQLCVYQYVITQMPDFFGQLVETGIWSFAEVNKGVVPLNFQKGSIDNALVSIKNLINEILDPNIDFIEEKRVVWDD